MLETILVIDDDEETRQSIAQNLESKGYLVFFAGGEDAAVIMARKTNPGLIFASPAVSGGKGLEICKRIHNTEHLKNVPIIILSSFEGARDPHFTALYGIVDSLQKPFNPDELFAKTQNALSPAQTIVMPSDTEPFSDLAGAGEEASSEEMPATPDAPPDIREQLFPSMNQPGHKPEEEIPVEWKNIDSTEPAMDSPVAKTKLPVALIAVVVIVMLGAVGFMFYYKDSLREAKSQKTPMTGEQPLPQTAQVSPNPAPQPDAKDAPSKPEVPVAPVTSSILPKPETPVPKSETPAAPAVVAKEETKTKIPESPAHKPKAETKEAGKTAYSVQVGVFKSRKNASSLKNRYDSKGYEAFMLKTLSNDKKSSVYRVLIGRFSSKREAADWAKKISTEEHIKTTIFKP